MNSSQLATSMSAEFLPLYRLCGTSISSIAHSWNGRLYSVKRFQSAYARRTMILPFSSNRSSTSLISKALYCASLTPRAMFSKSMNSASLRSPFIHDVLSCAEPLPRPRVSLSLSIICRRARSHEEVVTAVYSGARGMLDSWRSRMTRADPALAGRIPPGQTLTTKWPVLTYGLTPRFDPKTWTFRCSGLLEEEVSWTWDEFLKLPRTEVACDIHCVTRWSKLDNVWEGVHVREIMKRVK